MLVRTLGARGTVPHWNRKPVHDCPSVPPHRAPQEPPDPCRKGPRGRRLADFGAVDDQHADDRRQGHDRADPADRTGRRRPRARLVPGPGIGAGAEGDHPRDQHPGRRRHPFPLQARDRSGPERRRLPAHQPRQHRLRRPGARGGAGRQGLWLLDPDRRQCRLAGKGPAGEVRRALPGSDGRKRPRPCPHPGRPRFPRVQDQRQGVRRVPGGRGLSGSGGSLRLSAAYRHHRGRRPALRHGQVLDRPRHAAVVRASATRSASRSPPSRRKRCWSATRC